MKIDFNFMANGSAKGIKAMNILLVNGIFSLILCMVAAPADVMVLGNPSFAADHSQPGRICTYSRPHSMLQANCSKKELENFPEKINTKTEIMVLTKNRLRAPLPPDTFAPFTSLQYLYLDDNILDDINNTIKDLQNLQGLDISTNFIDVLPSSLFQLPYLRQLDLTKNRVKDATFELTVTSPIENLAMGQNKLTKIPSIGPQASLIYLNVSGNEIKRISVDDVAPFCKLKVLDITKNPIKLDSSSCDCHQFVTWVKIRNITVVPNIACKSETLDSCNAQGFRNETMASYNECLQLIATAEAQAKAKRIWITSGSCILAFFVCLIIGLYCIHKRNKKRQKKAKRAQRLAANNANTELLNGNLGEPV